MPRAFAIHIPTGAVYVWSMWQGPLAQSLGVLTPAAALGSALVERLNASGMQLSVRPLRGGGVGEGEPPRAVRSGRPSAPLLLGHATTSK